LSGKCGEIADGFASRCLAQAPFCADQSRVWEVTDVTTEFDRSSFLKKAGLGAAAAVGVPALLAPEAFAGGQNGQRVYTFVSFSRAPATATIAQPQIGMRGDGVFKPDAGYVHGGGTYVFFDNAASNPKPLLASGDWSPVDFVSYTTKGLSSYGNIQPGILEMHADLEGFASGVTLRLVCNVGALGAGGMTGEPEGWALSGAPGFGTFAPIIFSVVNDGMVPFGITHLSVEGDTIDRGS
jgi:hypothetical protein